MMGLWPQRLPEAGVRPHVLPPLTSLPLILAEFPCKRRSASTLVFDFGVRVGQRWLSVTDKFTTRGLVGQ